MNMTKRVLALFLSLVMMLSCFSMFSLEVGAVTFDELNASNVFLKQAGNTTCTLCAATMMLRRYSILRGDSGWKNITESSVKNTAWINGEGLRWSWSYSTTGVNSISVGHYTLPGGSSNSTQIQKALKDCPEGIVIYNTSIPHAVLITDYTDGIFYCADPYGKSPSGRIPITSNVLGVTISNVTAYWKVTSPIVPGPSFPKHTVNNSYGKNFTAYPKAKITASNIFDANHVQISSTAWIGTSDK